MIAVNLFCSNCYTYMIKTQHQSLDLEESPGMNLGKSDPVLAKIMESIDEPIIESTNDVFFDLVTCITDQQIHYRSKGGYMKKLMALLEGQIPTPGLILSLDPHEFAAKKISGIKYKALMNVASYWIEQDLDQVNWHQLSDTQIKSTLLPIKGIGAWTVDMILLYTLGRPNVFNANDFQLKKVMKHCYGLADGPELTNEMSRIADCWSPHKSLAVKYLLAWRNYLKKR